MHIRCPIHGTLPVTQREIKLIDHPAFQRLRTIKQLGFADLSFPGATHTRYAHSMGAMQLATRLFDRLFPVRGDGATPDLPERVRARFRQTVRLAMLFHDLGHAPLSHTTELLMPAVGELGLGVFAGDDVQRRATHEDYTLKIVLDSSLGQLVEEQFGDSDGIAARDVAELIVGATWPGASSRFRHGGVDYAPALRQIVSSECDADRMDYLQRDSFYSGVNYGKFDADWLIDNVTAVERDGQVFLGIRSRAIFSFEDFLLSRYHMFASVYLHYTPVIFEKMLARYFDEARQEFRLPADIERYTQLDDMDLILALRKSKNPWARRIVERRPFVLLDEHNEGHQQARVSVSHDELVRRLKDARIDHIATRSRSVLSKYFDVKKKAPIFVVTSSHDPVPLEEYTPLYARYNKPALLLRVFVDPERRVEARAVLQQLVDEHRDRPRATVTLPPQDA
ncbi:MAG: HD domain-containing protein [Deltaproteobacteria bacterium]|nr:HD domain-containing protein [Deltaproteobacteria bacterium]